MQRLINFTFNRLSEGKEGRERDHWGDLGVDGWIILGWISRRWDVGIWTGLGWPRIDSWRTLVSAVMNLRFP